MTTGNHKWGPKDRDGHRGHKPHRHHYASYPPFDPSHQLPLTLGEHVDDDDQEDDEVEQFGKTGGEESEKLKKGHSGDEYRLPPQGLGKFGYSRPPATGYGPPVALPPSYAVPDVPVGKYGPPKSDYGLVN